MNIIIIQFYLLENFHHLYSLLCQTKITALDGLRKECKIKYNDALKAYVTLYFGRPLEKLNVRYEFIININRRIYPKISYCF